MSELARGVRRVRENVQSLEQFFLAADEEIAGNPNDPRDRLGRLPGLERALLLSTVMLDRLEEDLGAGKIARGAARDADTARVLRGLKAVSLALESARKWHEDEELDLAVDGMNEAAAGSESALAVPRDDQPGRFCHDLGRISEDVRVMASMLELFQRNRRRRPQLPSADSDPDWSAMRWFEMYLDQARREDRLFEIVERDGLSLETLRRGVEAAREDERDLEREKHLILSSHETLDKRGQVYDPDNPEAFLNLPQVPELNIDDEFDVEAIGDGIVQFTRKDGVEERENHGFTFELPDDLDGANETESERRDREDPVLEIIEPVVIGVLRSFKDERDLESEVGPLQNYVALVLLKSLARIASSPVHCEDSENRAPIHGAYLFALHCLDRAATGLERFGNDTERAAAGPLRGVRLRASEFV